MFHVSSAKITKSHCLCASTATLAARWLQALALSIGGIVFVIFAIFCENDFFLVPPCLARKTQRPGKPRESPTLWSPSTCSRWSSATLLLNFMARLRLGFCNSTIRRYRLLERQLSGSDAALLNRCRFSFFYF